MKHIIKSFLSAATVLMASLSIGACTPSPGDAAQETPESRASVHMQQPADTIASGILVTGLQDNPYCSIEDIGNKNNVASEGNKISDSIVAMVSTVDSYIWNCLTVAVLGLLILVLLVYYRLDRKVKALERRINALED